MKNWEIKSLIACEDVRQEVNNKSTIVGVFSRVIFPSLPTIMRLSLWVECAFQKAGMYNIGIRVDTPSVEKAVVINLEMEIEEGKSSLSTAVPQFPLKIDDAGYISIFVKEKSQEKWKLCRAINIAQGEIQGPKINVNWK